MAPNPGHSRGAVVSGSGASCLMSGMLMFLAAEVKPASAIELNVTFQVPRVQCGVNMITSDQMVCVNQRQMCSDLQ